MPNNNREFSLNFDSSNMGKVRRGKIEDVYVYAGYPFADVMDIYGNLYTECSVLGMGGDSNNWSHAPLRRGMEVILLPTGYNSKAIIIGTLFIPRNLSSDKLGLEIKDLITPIAQDHLAQSNQDFIVAVGESNAQGIPIDTNYLQITPKNGVVVETDNHVRIQLPEDGILRISSNREIVDEPLNGQQFINTITPVFESLDAINGAQGDVLTKLGAELAAIKEAMDVRAKAIVASGGTGAPMADEATVLSYLMLYFMPLLTNISASIIDDLALTNTQYDTLEMQDIVGVFKPKMEATINRKVKLPK